MKRHSQINVAEGVGSAAGARTEQVQSYYITPLTCPGFETGQDFVEVKVERFIDVH